MDVIKSGCYTCNVCKKFFTAHTRLFLSKSDGYACPYCKSLDWTEEERGHRNEGTEVGWYPMYLKEPEKSGVYDVTIETPDGTRLANVGYLTPERKWELLIDRHNYKDCYVLAWTHRPNLWKYIHEEDIKLWSEIKEKYKVV